MNRSQFTFTFMHLADAFIQSNLHCIQVTVLHFISSCFPWETSILICFCNNVKVFTVMFDQFDAYLLKKSINLIVMLFKVCCHG